MMIRESIMGLCFSVPMGMLFYAGCIQAGLSATASMLFGSFAALVLCAGAICMLSLCSLVEQFTSIAVEEITRAIKNQ